ncbi:MAG: GntR family transcriptional regulator, partial [Pseudomonadota bacterium]
AGQPQPDDVGVPVSAPRRVRRKSAATDTASAPAVIAEAIERQIKTGELANGQRLPTEIEMAAQFGVARDTIRKALRSLAQRGLIVSSKRVGTFVSSDRIDYRISRESSFRSNMEDADRAASEQIIDCRTVIVPGDIANQLDIASKSQVIQIEELKLANDLPFVWRQSWYPADRFGRLETILTAGSTIREAL